MTLSVLSPRSLWLAVGLVIATAFSAQADYKDDIGYTAFLNELGAATPNGAGVSVSQVEASTSQSSNQYLPTFSAYSGVTFTNKSGTAYPGTVSSHADMVGQLIYGDASMGSGITTVNTYLADHWINAGALNSSSFLSAPIVETADVQNHSWVGSGSNNAVVLHRLDYAIERDDFVAVVGVNNGASADQPLLSSAYNVISVGVSSGNHSSTPSGSIQRPHLVAPVGTTSEATAVVSSAATLLIQQARSSSTTSANGAKSETIKAIMLAGATKSEFPTWSQTQTMPLDSVYGAGELNVYNNYHIMAAGEQGPSATPEAVVAATGWDYHTMATNQPVSYYFNLTTESNVSIALTWNAIYTASGVNYNNLTLALANLDLSLFSVDENGDLHLVQLSASPGENLEYIWAIGLSEGKYVIQVSSATSGTDYALAWQSAAVPEPSLLGLFALGLGLVFVLRRRVRA